MSGARCCICGLEFFDASLGGPDICPACDCGFTPTGRQKDEIDALHTEVCRLRAVVDRAGELPEEWHETQWTVKSYHRGWRDARNACAEELKEIIEGAA